MRATEREMKKDNETIELSGEEALRVLAEIEYILISLRNIGRYYHAGPAAAAGPDPDYAQETNRFIDEGRVTRRLAEVRKIITAKFDRSLGVDDMDDVERAMEHVKVWEKPGDL
ncbi:TPA: hypothetical protein QDC20_003496 [Burkholderia aenigmatica]|uniref:hypothetical protein n=1 Tax=Burkholderia sp. AU45251 TaxID=3059204 RepID=UPI002653CB98|nr:hypothetical protein [Burkholderia sp. AU45251]HDR9484074.1 hypothetical protein [Burkholderia aenigmatica]MDN7516334.1 hypothetical protein [Burkholderia sp. AU45251]HDR9515039.1 hypothetical protein [Burkholderia aenigmatica]HDR9592124.1 hypothetical protein [Burkholderia aenigmatica]HDR9602877.1 hypothetical protein [Burkholderia aenigmatica]